MIQAHIRGFIGRLKYQANRLVRRESAALSLQSYFRAFAKQKVYSKARNALLRC